MRLAAAECATDLRIVKLLLIISKFLWQVIAYKDNVPNDLLIIKQDWLVSLPYFLGGKRERKMLID
jgi:hypothetical protein